MNRARLEFALEEIDPTRWKDFEEFCSEYLASEWPELRTLASQAGDAGRDAALFSPEGEETVAIQYSLAKDWRGKIRATAISIRKHHPNVVILVYLTNQKIGAAADDIKKELRKNYRLVLDVRDRDWFAERINANSAQEIAAETLAEKVVDPLLARKDIISYKASPLTHDEARAALLYLGMQWEDENRQKGLTKLGFEALVRAALRETDSEHRLSRTQVHEKFFSYLPSHNRDRLKTLSDAALGRLAKNVVRHWQNDDEFCLSHEELQRLSTRELEIQNETKSIDAEISEYLEHFALTNKIDNLEVGSATTYVRKLLEAFFLRKGERYASGIVKGEITEFGANDFRDIAIQESYITPLPTGLDLDDIVQTVLDFIINPSDRLRKSLRRLSDSYTLMAFFRETPDVQTATRKMFSFGDIWFDTSMILPLIAESLYQDASGRFTSVIRAGFEIGLKYHVTNGVIEEVERHINRCLSYQSGAKEWAGRVPYLYKSYVLLGASRGGFQNWIEQFMGSERPEEDIAEYLLDEFGIDVINLEKEMYEAPEELRFFIQERWLNVHQTRRERRGDQFDQMAIQRLAQHDVENFLGVLVARSKESFRQSLGYQSWWITLDSLAYQIWGECKDEVGKTLKISTPPMMSADFLYNYLVFGPGRERLSKASEAKLPLVLWQDLYEIPREMLEHADKLRSEAEGIPERIIRRRIRDQLDKAKMRRGAISIGGLKFFEEEIDSRGEKP